MNRMTVSKMAKVAISCFWYYWVLSIHTMTCLAIYIHVGLMEVIRWYFPCTV
jgi:hypothetical protein